MLLGLSGGQKLSLALVAAVFIGFALVSSFLLPRRMPDFPGRGGLKFFIALSVILFVAMLAAVVVFARESEEEGVEREAAAGETRAGETEPGETGPDAAGETSADAGQEGEEVFASAGCGGCHTLAAANSSGQIGPNLDESMPDRELVVTRVTEGRGVMPSFEDQLSEEQIEAVAAYVVDATK